jgi:hypothetical protein
MEWKMNTLVKFPVPRTVALNLLRSWRVAETRESLLEQLLEDKALDVVTNHVESGKRFEHPRDPYIVLSMVIRYGYCRDLALLATLGGLEVHELVSMVVCNEFSADAPTPQEA